MKQRRLGHLASLLCALMCALGTACALDTMKVTVLVPELPEPWASADGWEVRWATVSGLTGCAAASPGERLQLPLPRGEEAVVTCRAVFGSAKTLPYGALWPADRLDDGSIQPSASGGYVAALALILLPYGWASFNFDRLEAETTSRLADSWDVDPRSIAEAVAESRFRADHLNQPDRFQVAVEGLAGPLAPDSPWGQTLSPDAAGTAVAELAPGLRRWMGDGLELVVWLSQSGDSAWTLRERR